MKYVNVSGEPQRDADGNDWKPLETAELNPDSHATIGLLAYGYIRPVGDQAAVNAQPDPQVRQTGDGTAVLATPATGPVPESVTAAKESPAQVKPERIDGGTK